MKANIRVVSFPVGRVLTRRAHHHCVASWSGHLLLGNAVGLFLFLFVAIGTFEILIGSRALYSDHVLLRSTSLFSGTNWWQSTKLWFCCQVGPYHLTLTQMNSENNCIAKNQCPDSQKLDSRGRGENLTATSHVSRATTCVFLHSFFLLSFWNKVLFCRMFWCYYWSATHRWFDHTKTW